MKNDQLIKFAQTKEDLPLLGSVLDKADACFQKNIQTNTCFLDPRQQAMVQAMLRALSLTGHFHGGYSGAERKLLLFLPSYLEEPADLPLSVLRVTHSGHRSLTHRDYLGSLLGLGIKRERVGDLLVRPDGCDIVLLKELEPYLAVNYQKAGAVSLSVSFVPLSELQPPALKTKSVSDTVSSLRLDAVLSSAFFLSRTQCVKAIQSGKVFVNGMEVTKPDKTVEQGDQLTFRGKGKALLKEVGGTSKKGRLFIQIEVFL